MNPFSTPPVSAAPAGGDPFSGFAPPPPPDAPNDAAQAAFADAMDDEDLRDVQKTGDLIPTGTYTARIAKCEARVGKSPAGSFDPQPMFAVQFAIQEEPFVGRRVFDNVLWISPEVAAACNDTSNPRCAEARKIRANRLGRWKAIKDDGFALKGKVSPKDVLFDTTRELKLVIGQQKKREKNEQTGEWESTGEMQNVITKYLPLRG